MNRVIHPHAFEAAEAVATAMRELGVSVSSVLGVFGATLPVGTHRWPGHRRGCLSFSCTPASCSRAPSYVPHRLSGRACGALIGRQACPLCPVHNARPLLVRGAWTPPAGKNHSRLCDKELRR